MAGHVSIPLLKISSSASAPSLYRIGPRPHRKPQPLVRVRQHHHPCVVKTVPDDLQPNRQPAVVVTRTYGSCRLLRHIERRGEYDVIERVGRSLPGAGSSTTYAVMERSG